MKETSWDTNFCIKCGIELTETNWRQGSKRHSHKICIPCHDKILKINYRLRRIKENKPLLTKPYTLLRNYRFTESEKKSKRNKIFCEMTKIDKKRYAELKDLWRF